MFKRNKISKLIGDIDSYFNTLDKASSIFQEGVRNYLYSNMENFNTNLNDMSRTQDDLSELKREIEFALYTQTSLIRTRSDIMRLLEKTRNIADLLNESLFQFEIEMPLIPSDLNPDFMKLTEFSILAVQSIIPAAKDYFIEPDMIPDKISRAYYYEKEATRFSQNIKRTVFHKMDNLKLSEKFHLRYFALHIENIAKAAENVADQLAVMVTRRSL